MKSDVQTNRRTTAISVLMVFVLVLLLIQLWLLTISMEEFLAGHVQLALPTFLASAGCFGINLWLLRYVNGIDAAAGRER